MHVRNPAKACRFSRKPGIADLLLLLLLTGFLAAIALYGYQDAEGSAYVLIRRPDGRELRYPLTEQRELRLQGSAGAFRIRISGGQVSITETHCPNRYCQHSGPISQPGASMICMPQRIEIMIVSPDNNRGVDAICQ